MGADDAQATAVHADQQRRATTTMIASTDGVDPGGGAEQGGARRGVDVISPLERLERLIAGVVEGAAARLFPGAVQVSAIAAPASEESVVERRPAGGLLAVVRGSGAPAEVRLDGREVRIGRAEDNDLVLQDRAVSRNHASVRWAADGYAVVDLGSVNGTLLNGRRVHEAGLRHGDCLRLGETEVVFRERSA